jgi:phosphoribosyl 1,2-cyclic phosphodiesterase
MEDLVMIRVLASGSSGNALFVRVGEQRLLVDAGISLTRIEDGLAKVGESVDRLDALILTHEHTDHIRGLDRLMRRYPRTPLLASRGTYDALDIEWSTPPDWQTLSAGASAFVGDVELRVFGLVHDAAEPTGFRLESPHFTFGFATDLGFWTDEVADALQGCHALVVESNYDNEMLENGPYPRFLKRRISSSKGHLSNEQAAALLRRVGHDELECVVLAHLSEKNNDPDLAVQTARSAVSANVQVVAARRKKPSEVLTFDGRQSRVRRDEGPRQGRLF